MCVCICACTYCMCVTFCSLLWWVLLAEISHGTVFTVCSTHPCWIHVFTDLSHTHTQAHKHTHTHWTKSHQSKTELTPAQVFLKKQYVPAEPSVLPVAVFINSNTHPCTWWPPCFLHVGPVLHPSLLYTSILQPHPLCALKQTLTLTLKHAHSATGGYRSPLWKLGRWGVGKGSGAVIIFIIINFHLKVAPGLFCPLQSSFQTPCIHTHTQMHRHTHTTTITANVFEKAACQTRQNRGRGHKRGKSSKGWKECDGKGQKEKQRQEELHVSLHHSLDPNLH